MPINEMPPSYSQIQSLSTHVAGQATSQSAAIKPFEPLSAQVSAIRGESAKTANSMIARDSRLTGSILQTLLSAIGLGKREPPREKDVIKAEMSTAIKTMLNNQNLNGLTQAHKNNFAGQLADQLVRLDATPRALEKFNTYLQTADPNKVVAAVIQNTLIGHLVVNS